MTKKIFFLLKIFILFLSSINIVQADLKKNLINKLTGTQTLTFDFKQKIADKEEIGNCFIKYPLLMKCNYKNSKGKTIISNGKTVAVIKKKYKKIYLYPIKSTPLSFILEKEKIKCAAAAKIAKNQLDLCVSDLDYTTKQLAKKSTNNLKWFSVGAASGIAFTLVTAWAIGKVVN